MADADVVRIREVGTVAVPVTDPDRALEFYCGTLGLEKRRDVPIAAGGRWIEVGPHGGTTTIALAPPGTSSVGVDTGIRLYADDAEAVHADLVAGGADAGDVMRWPGVPPMFSLRDPDGNTLYVVESGS
jgi:catechol 2,3-dioxygenase-like lactoylglutathione lyase family enzyme